MTAPEALGFVNGVDISARDDFTPLGHGSRLVLGTNHVFRFHDPVRAAMMKQQLAEEGVVAEESDFDWHFARKEVRASRTARSARHRPPPC